MKKGILGGTFNPIHNGHINIARHAIKELCLDFVLIMPSCISYMKAGTNVLDSKIRFEMTRRAICDEPQMILDDREIQRGGNSYTYMTLLELKAESPDDELFYIIGEDTLFNIVNWKNPEIIFELATICVARRRDDLYINHESDIKIQEHTDMLKAKYGARIIFLSCDKIDISSTDIREKIKNNQDVSDFVKPSVYDYIVGNKLYK